MYAEFFNLREEPFNLTPDPKYYYFSRGHQEALEQVLYGIDQKKGFVLLADDIGTGKTTLSRMLMDRLSDQAYTALIFNTFLNELELLRSINREFGLQADHSSCETLVRILNDFLLKCAENRQKAVLIIDEAQNLSIPVLEQVRMLSNLETDSQKLIQIVLLGQPELTRILARREMAQLNQRIMIRCSLPVLNWEETANYIRYRLSVAGPQGWALFEPRSLRLIHRYSQGVPRRINALCDRALLVAFSRSDYRITPAFIRQARIELAGNGSAKGGSWFGKLLFRVRGLAITSIFNGLFF